MMNNFFSPKDHYILSFSQRHQQYCILGTFGKSRPLSIETATLLSDYANDCEELGEGTTLSEILSNYLDEHPELYICFN